MAWPAQPPQSGDQPQVRPRCSPCAVATAAAALTRSCGLPAGFLTSPSAGNRVRLPVEQQAQKRKANTKAIAKKPPSFNSPPNPNGCKSRTSPDFIAVSTPPKTVQLTARCMLSSQITLMICLFFLGASGWLCTPESGKELAGGETRMGRVGEWAPGGEGLAGHWSLIGCLLILRCK